MNQSPYGFPQFDPSKMDPKTLMQLSQLVQQLPPEKLSQMQSLMHNMMAGFDVRAQMEEFERSLPADFREKLMAVIGNPFAQQSKSPLDVASSSTRSVTPPVSAAASSSSESSSSAVDMNLREARLTILKAVAEGKLPPEEAERLLFN